ncbi:MAG: bifunctional glutamate N-acetyltransferase/amino-acid acetyltransferase ArgJ [Lachnospiraceae bacterium]|nr:bifunctional glutamate N-acetyltransferase/amino-acid acetyltransferase ArgJ [Lachnospiraceae bacterium]
MMDRIVAISGGVTSPKGFAAASYAAGIKYRDREDMALIYSEQPCTAAGVFTSNVVKAAPVIWDQQVVEKADYVRAVIINSGIANACTGEEGMKLCRATAEAAAELTGDSPENILVVSTGVIGMQIPIDRIVHGTKELLKRKETTREVGTKAAQAIMTTDTHKKETAITVTLSSGTVTIGGMCKGSGMIHPNMCTMLGFITTDAAISKTLLQKALSEVVQDTFNMVSVDGDTSTNDTLVVLANGVAGNQEIVTEDEDYQTIKEALYQICEYLAKQMAGDGEGATALLEVTVQKAKTKADAKILAKSVVCSSLVKAMIYGHDANAGRIMCALGYSGVNFQPEKVDLYFTSKAGKILIFQSGIAADYSEEEATKILSEPEVTVVVDMHEGDASATAWGCDLTYDYVKINADYRS